MGSTTIATYLPESMLIGIGPDLRLLDENGQPIELPSAAAFAWFFHEYAHYLHNISTASGIAAFINTIELWQCFRLTIDPHRYSLGSTRLRPEQRDHLKTLTAYLKSARRNNKPALQKLTNVEAIRVLSIEGHDEVTSTQGPILSAVECEVELTDSGGQTETLKAKVGTLELLEGAAWLLEKRMAAALNPTEDITQPAAFPYMIAQAAAEYALPCIDDEGTLACILAALQSSDAPGSFRDLLSEAANENPHSTEITVFFRNYANAAIDQNSAALEEKLTGLESVFVNDGAMAKAVRHIVSAARLGFAERRRAPLFELDMIASIKSGSQTPQEMLRRFLPCAVLQKNPGGSNDLQRDFLLSFYPPENAAGDDIEGLLRVVQCIFHFVNVHRSTSGFVNTKEATHRPCPYYTSCDLALRRTQGAICGQSPWEAADWPEWGEKGRCWYGTAVHITRPPRD